MFTAEIKVNGAQIGHVYGHNTRETSNGYDKYEWCYHSPFRAYSSGIIWHQRSEDFGLEKLIKNVLDEVLTDEHKTEKY